MIKSAENLDLCKGNVGLFDSLMTGPLPISILKYDFYMDFSRLQGRSEGGPGVPVTPPPPLCKRFFFFFKKTTHNIAWRKRHDDNV